MLVGMARRSRSVQHWLDWPYCHAGRPHLHALIGVGSRFVLKRIALGENKLVVQIAAVAAHDDAAAQACELLRQVAASDW